MSARTPITSPSEYTVARRIARQHNRGHAELFARFGHPDGYLVFTERGGLLRWQNVVAANTEHGALQPHEIAFRRRSARVTTAEVLAFLQARNGTTPKELTPTPARKPIEIDHEEHA